LSEARRVNSRLHDARGSDGDDNVNSPWSNSTERDRETGRL